MRLTVLPVYRAREPSAKVSHRCDLKLPLPPVVTITEAPSPAVPRARTSPRMVWRRPSLAQSGPASGGSVLAPAGNSWPVATSTGLAAHRAFLNIDSIPFRFIKQIFIFSSSSSFLFTS